LELLARNDAFGLQAGVDDDHVGTDLDNDADDNCAGLELGELFALLEQFSKTFGHEMNFRLHTRTATVAEVHLCAALRTAPVGGFTGLLQETGRGICGAELAAATADQGCRYRQCWPPGAKSSVGVGLALRRGRPSR